MMDRSCSVWRCRLAACTFALVGVVGAASPASAADESAGSPGLLDDGAFAVPIGHVARTADGLAVTVAADGRAIISWPASRAATIGATDLRVDHGPLPLGYRLGAFVFQRGQLLTLPVTRTARAIRFALPAAEAPPLDEFGLILEPRMPGPIGTGEATLVIHAFGDAAVTATTRGPAAIAAALPVPVDVDFTTINRAPPLAWLPWIGGAAALALIAMLAVAGAPRLRIAAVGIVCAAALIALAPTAMGFARWAAMWSALAAARGDAPGNDQPDIDLLAAAMATRQALTSAPVETDVLLEVGTSRFVAERLRWHLLPLRGHIVAPGPDGSTARHCTAVLSADPARFGPGAPAFAVPNSHGAPLTLWLPECASGAER